MKIMILTSNGNSLINFRGGLISSLISKGYKIYASSSKISYFHKKKFSKKNVKFYQIKYYTNNFSIFSDLKYIYNLFFLLIKIKPNLLLTFTIKANIFGSLVSWFLKIKSISVITGLGYIFLDNNDNLKIRILKQITKKLYKISTSLNKYVVFQNKYDLKDFLKNNNLIDKKRAILIESSGVNLRYFKKKKLPSNKNFLMIARLLKSKGVIEFLKAVEIVKKKYPNIKFTLVGKKMSSSDSIDLKLLQNLKRKNYIRHINNVNDIRPVINNHRFFVLPSYREGTSRSILEAMSIGRPIITTDVPGCRETVVNGKNGFKVKKKNFHQLASKMIKMIELNNKKHNSMAYESCLLAKKKFDEKKINKRYLELTNNSIN